MDFFDFLMFMLCLSCCMPLTGLARTHKVYKRTSLYLKLSKHFFTCINPSILAKNARFSRTVIVFYTETRN